MASNLNASRQLENIAVGASSPMSCCPASQKRLGRHSRHNPLLSGGITLELTGRETMKQASSLADDMQADSAPVRCVVRCRQNQEPHMRPAEDF